MDIDLTYKGINLSGSINGTKKIIVPLSGGKDSQACLKLALNEHPKQDLLAVFCDTQFEHPVTYEHILKTVKNYDVDLVTLNSGSVLQVCTKYKRFPGGGARHCTDELKIRPAKFFYKALAQQQGGFEVWIGVRSEESKEREKRYKGKVGNEVYAPHEFMSKYPKYLAKLGVMFRLPIIDWATDEVLDLLDGEQNPLYSYGFGRVGCFPCLASGEKYQMKAFKFDDTGSKHYSIAEQISVIANRPVFTSKKFAGSNPGCSICSI